MAAIGGAFMSMLLTGRDSHAQSQQQPSVDSPAALAPSPSVVPPLDFSSLRASTLQPEEEAEDALQPNTLPVASNSGGTGLTTRGTQRPGALRSMSRRSLRRTFFSQPNDVRTESDITALDDMFYTAYACRHLTRSARTCLARMAQLERFDPGETLCLPQTPMHCVYFLIGGQVEYRPEGAGEATVTLEPGASLGTLLPVPPIETSGTVTARLQSQGITADLVTPRTRMWPNAGDMPRMWGGTATALSECETAVVTQEQWRQLVAEEPRWDARQVASFLEDLPIFGQLNRTQLFELARLVRVRSVPAGSLVFRQGSEGEEVYILRRGYVRLLRELQVQRSTRDAINVLTHTMAGLRYKLELLTTPRAAALQPIQVEPTSPASPCTSSPSGLGSKHASGAVTHRPRLQHHSRNDDMPRSPGSPSKSVFHMQGTAESSGHLRWLPTPSDHDSDGEAWRHTISPASPRKSCSPLRLPPTSPRGGHPTSPGGLHGAWSPGPQSWSSKSPRHGTQTERHSPSKKGDKKHLSTRTSLTDKENSKDDPTTTPRGGAPGISPRKSVHHDDAHQAQIERERRAHLRDVGRASVRVMRRAVSRHSLTLNPSIDLGMPAPSPVLDRTSSNTRTEGATDRLLETLRSKKRAELKLLAADATPETATTPPAAPKNLFGRPSGVAGGRGVSQQSMGSTLGPAAQLPFASTKPRHLGAEEPVVFVEMGLLASGRVFGEGNKGDTGKQRVVSAVADTNIELLALDRAEIEARLGDMVTFLWNQEPMEGKPLVSDMAIRGQLERTMKWEVYKKQLLQDVFVQKRARLDQR